MNELQPAALYLRRSTSNLQPDSLLAQEEALRRYAEIHNLRVVAVFSDSASGRTVKNRNDFLRLISVVTSGRADFSTVLVRDISRWGRFENPDQGAYYCFLCAIHGVNVVFAEESFAGESAAYVGLMKSVKRCIAAEFSRDKARLISAAQQRLAKLGFFVAGQPPYALKKILVDRDGRVVAEMKKGDRKLLANFRTRLAPGDPKEVLTVQRIFKMYGVELLGVPEIIHILNREETPSPSGGRWSSHSVYYILGNEAYTGTIVYRIGAHSDSAGVTNTRDDEESRRIVRGRNAFPRIIPADLWRRVEERLRTRTWRRTDADLVKSIRSEARRWGSSGQTLIEMIDSGSGREELVRTFRLPARRDMSLYSAEIQTAIRQLRRRLSSSFFITNFDDGWILDDLLHIRFKASTPVAYLGRLHWEFAFDGNETEDVTICLGLSPPPDVSHVETFVFAPTHDGIARARRPNLCNMNKDIFRDRGAGALEQHLRRRIYFRNKSAERAFLAAVENLPLINIAEVARSLKWTFTTTLGVYKKLLRRGVPLPPRKKMRGRRIEVKCSRCGEVRIFTPSQALARRSDMCFECLYRKPKTSFAVTCPRCRTTRRVPRWHLKKLAKGLRSLCGQCALAEGRERRLNGLKARNQ